MPRPAPADPPSAAAGPATGPSGRPDKTERPRPGRRGYPINHHVAGAAPSPADLVRLAAPGPPPAGGTGHPAEKGQQPEPLNHIHQVGSLPLPPGMIRSRAAASTAPLRARSTCPLQNPAVIKGDREQTQPRPRPGQPDGRASVIELTGRPRNLTREPSRGPSSGYGQVTSLPDRRKAHGSSPLVKFLHTSAPVAPHSGLPARSVRTRLRSPADAGRRISRLKRRAAQTTPYDDVTAAPSAGPMLTLKGHISATTAARP